MKLFFTVIAVLILVLTVIDKVRIRFGYKTTKTIISDRWLLVAILMCLLLIGITGHQYYTTKESGAFSKMLIPVALLIVMIDQWRRR